MTKVQIWLTALVILAFCLLQMHLKGWCKATPKPQNMPMPAKVETMVCWKTWENYYTFNGGIARRDVTVCEERKPLRLKGKNNGIVYDFIWE